MEDFGKALNDHAQELVCWERLGHNLDVQGLRERDAAAVSRPPTATPTLPSVSPMLPMSWCSGATRAGQDDGVQGKWMREGRVQRGLERLADLPLGLVVQVCFEVRGRRVPCARVTSAARRAGEGVGVSVGASNISASTSAHLSSMSI